MTDNQAKKKILDLVRQKPNLETKYISRMTGVDLETTTRCLGELADEGWITPKFQPSGESSVSKN